MRGERGRQGTGYPRTVLSMLYLCVVTFWTAVLPPLIQWQVNRVNHRRAVFWGLWMVGFWMYDKGETVFEVYIILQGKKERMAAVKMGSTGSVHASPIPCTRKVSAAGSSLFKTVTKLCRLHTFVLPRFYGRRGSNYHGQSWINPCQTSGDVKSQTFFEKLAING